METSIGPKKVNLVALFRICQQDVAAKTVFLNLVVCKDIMFSPMFTVNYTIIK